MEEEEGENGVGIVKDFYQKKSLLLLSASLVFVYSLLSLFIIFLFYSYIFFSHGGATLFYVLFFMLFLFASSLFRYLSILIVLYCFIFFSPYSCSIQFFSHPFHRVHFLYTVMRLPVCL